MSEKDARKPDLSDITFYRKKLKALLKPERYEHSLSVSFTCVCLAMRYGVPLHQAEVAGLVHDCAKHFSGKELVERCEKDGIALSIEMLQAPQVIHSVYGSVYAKQAFGITDPDILSAIYYHTLGRPAMTPLEKIVFTADYIEARRYKADSSLIWIVRSMKSIKIPSIIFRKSERQSVRILLKHTTIIKN